MVNRETDVLDLSITGLTLAPAAGFQSGATLTVSWVVASAGNIPTPAGFTDAVVVRNLTTGETLASASVPYDPAAAGNSPIAPGGGRARRYTLRLPDGPRGAGRLEVTVTVTVTVNATRSVGESDPPYANYAATATADSALAAYPDLRPVTLRLDPAGGPRSGQSVVLRWDDANSGTGPAAAP